MNQDNGDSRPLFPPDSAMRAITGEAAILFGGGRALLLQLAHPLVAAGVAEHSDFQAAPQARLERTLDLMLTLTYGNRAEGRAMVREFQAVHRPIHGVLSEAAGPFPAGYAYDAADPQLRFWVAATLLDTTLLCYDRFVRRLTRAECEAYYEDSRAFARRLGIPPTVWPATLTDFRRYMRTMLASDVLTVTPAARQIAWDVFHPNLGPIPRAGAGALAFVAAALLPARLRRAFGLRWTQPRRALFRAGAAASRALLPRVPPRLRLVPQAGGGAFTEWLISQGRTGH